VDKPERMVGLEQNADTPSLGGIRRGLGADLVEGDRLETGQAPEHLRVGPEQ
jgi:hypothetical protein